MSFLCCCCSKERYERQYEKDGKIVSEYLKDTKKIKDVNLNQSVVRMNKSQYDSLLKKHKSGDKFTDTSFPPGSNSLGVIPNVPSDCEWKRISQIIQNPQLFVDGVEPADVVHGSLDDCYFLSAIAALAEDEPVIRKIFGGQQYNPNGVYKVALKIDGQVEEIVIDDFVPVNRAGKPLFCQPNNNQFWVVLLEKAWAKANGSYANISMGTPTDVFKAVSYAPSELKPIKFSNQSKEKIWEQILANASKRNPMCASTIRDQSSNIRSTGLDPGHGYTVLKAAELIDNYGNTQRMIKLRNPWGKNEWTGIGSENNDQFWVHIDPQQKDEFLQGMGKERDGIFVMRFVDFCDYFNEINFCYMLRYPKYEAEQMLSDKKHGSLYELDINKSGDYIFELHQSFLTRNLRELEQNLCRSTLLLVKADNYEFVDGVLKYQEEDTILNVPLTSGKYYLYSKVDPNKKNEIPKKMVVSCYSSDLVDMVPVKKDKHPDLFNKAFLAYARENKNPKYSDEKMWISWKLFFERGGFAYIGFGVAQSSDQKFTIKLDEKDFNEMGYILKKPYKGKGKSTIEVKPGEEIVIVARVKNGDMKSIKFPPKFDIQKDKA